MKILAIETSCDETAIAIVSEKNGKFLVEKNLVLSQMKTHAKYGGVVPEVAARMHMEAMFPMLEESGISRDGEGIDAIAVTAGPGLVVALRVGVETAKTLATLWNKPLIAVNHLEGHLASAWLEETQPEFPILSLMVSGGHTEIVLMKDFGDYEVLGSTRDDAAGEAFDKVAKLLGLGYPGGPVISARAKLGDPNSIALPRPMLKEKNFDFSFSGLKTAVLREVGKWKMENGMEDVFPELVEGLRPDQENLGLRQAQAINFVNNISASFQEAVVETLVTKMVRAAEEIKPQAVTLVGGVSANERLRESLNKLINSLSIQFVTPDRKYSTDNAVMIGVAGLMKLGRGETVDPLKLKADPHMGL